MATAYKPQDLSLRKQRDITSALPAEILEIIFQVLHDTSAELHRRDPEDSPWADSIRISHVCRRWRDIALNLSTLWNDLSTEMSDACWDAHLARSRDGLLYVKIDRPLRSANHRADVLANYPRVQSFCVATDYGGIDLGWLRSAFMVESPQLHTFDISDDDISTWDDTLNKYLTHYTPALRHLALSSFIFPWGAVLAQLRSLRLASWMFYHEDVEEYQGLNHTFEDVARSLQGAQCLEELSIWGDTVFTPPFEIPTPTISSRLRTMTLQGPISRVCILLAVFKASAVLQAKLRCDDRPIGADEDTQTELVEDLSTVSARASDILRRHLSSRASEGLPEFTAFHMIADATSVIARLGFDVVPLPGLLSTQSPGEESDSKGTDLPYINFRLDFTESSKNDKASIYAKTFKLSRCITTEQLQCIRHLVLSALCWPTQTVTELFFNAVHVESLTIYSVSKNFEHEVAQLVVDLVCTPASASEVDYAFPALRSLRIVGVDFAHPVQGRKGPNLSDVLINGLVQRKETGRGLETLQLEDCRHLVDGVVAACASVVPDIVCTGAHIEASSSQSPSAVA